MTKTSRRPAKVHARPGVVTSRNANYSTPTQRKRRILLQSRSDCYSNGETQRRPQQQRQTPKHYQQLLPVLVAVVVSLAAFPRAVGRVARVAGRGTHHVVARLAVGLRPLVVGLAGLVRLQEGGRLFGGLGGGRVDGGGGPRGPGPLGLVGLARAGGLVVRVLVPADFLLSRCGWTQVLLA